MPSVRKRTRAWLACAETIPSGTRTAAHTAPFPWSPFPIISMIQTSSASAMVKVSPSDA